MSKLAAVSLTIVLSIGVHDAASDLALPALAGWKDLTSVGTLSLEQGPLTVVPTTLGVFGEATSRDPIVLVEDHLLFWSDDGVITIFDRETLGQSRPIGIIPIGYSITDLMLVDDILVVKIGSSHPLILYDITVPSAATRLGKLRLPDRALSLASDGKLLFVMGNRSGTTEPSSSNPVIHAISLANPSAPDLVSSTEVPDVGAGRHISADSGRLALTASTMAENLQWEYSAHVLSYSPGAPSLEGPIASAPLSRVYPGWHIEVEEWLRAEIKGRNILLFDMLGVRVFHMDALPELRPVRLHQPGELLVQNAHMVGGHLYVLESTVGQHPDPSAVRASSFDLDSALDAPAVAIAEWEVQEKWASRFAWEGGGSFCQAMSVGIVCWDLSDSTSAAQPRQLVWERYQDSGSAPQCFEHLAFWRHDVLAACGSKVGYLKQQRSGRLYAAKGQSTSVRSMTTVAGRVFIMSSFGLSLLDPRGTPMLVTPVSVLAGKNVSSLRNANGYLVALHDEGLAVVEPQTLNLVSQIGGQDWPRQATHVRASGSQVYVGQEGSWRVVDLEDPTRPRVSDMAFSISVPGFDIMSTDFFSGMAISVANTSGDLARGVAATVFVHAIDEPEPTLVSKTTVLRDMPLRSGRAVAGAVSGSLLHVVIEGGYVVRLDLSDLRSPRRLGDLILPSETPRIVYADPVRIVFGLDFGMQVWTHGEAPGQVVRSQWVPSRQISGAVVIGDDASQMLVGDYVVAESKGDPATEGDELLRLYDAGFLGWPRIVGETENMAIIQVADDHMYGIRTRGRGFAVFDMSKPGAPGLIGNWCDSGSGLCPPPLAGERLRCNERLRVDDNIAFIATRGGDLVALDVADPGNLQELGRMQLDACHKPGALSRAGDYLLIQNQGTLLVDVSNPRAMTVAGELEHAHGASRFEFSNDVLFTTTTTGLRVIDLSVPESPVILTDLALVPSPAEREGRLDLDGSTVVVLLNQIAFVVDVSAPAEPRIDRVISLEEEDILYVEMRGRKLYVRGALARALGIDPPGSVSAAYLPAVVSHY